MGVVINLLRSQTPRSHGVLVEKCWVMKAQLPCAIYGTPSGLEVRARFAPDAPSRSARIGVMGDDRLIAALWRDEVLEKETFMDLRLLTGKDDG